MISVKNLYKEFKQDGKVLHILNGIDVDFKKGEKVAVIGPSGSGKSTFLRCINAMETPTSGEIFYRGERVDAKNPKIDGIRKNIGMVFQNYGLFPNLTVGKNLEIICKDDAKIDELLEKFELLDKKNLYPANLSGGQKQRVAIIRTLLLNPKIILFDEPTSALDDKNRDKIVELIGNLKESGFAIIVVTHDFKLVNNLDSKIFDMNNV